MIAIIWNAVTSILFGYVILKAAIWCWVNLPLFGPAAVASILPRRRPPRGDLALTRLRGFALENADFEIFCSAK
ncbi:MAG TPA: hypothetical protein VGI93_15180 [Steroidobacteraceae bacterium]